MTTAEPGAATARPRSAARRPGRPPGPLPWRAKVRRGAVVLGAELGLLGVLVGGVGLWAMPRAHVALPSPEATPEEVVAAYTAAVNARDFDTANAIDGRSRSDLGRFDRSRRIDIVGPMTTGWDPNGMRVEFEADFEGWDYSLQDGWWSYFLERGEDGRWQIVDEGVG